MILPLMILPKNAPHGSRGEKSKIIDGQNDFQQPGEVLTGLRDEQDF